MRGIISGAALAALTAGSALAQTAAPQTAAPSAGAAQTTPSIQPGAEKTLSAVAPRRTERVCKSEPIANSRLKSKKVCMSRSEFERVRNAQKEMVRDQMNQGGVQANQGGG